MLTGAVNATVVGNNTIIAASGAGSRIKVIGFIGSAKVAGTFQFTDGAGGTAITEPFQVAAGSPIFIPIQTGCGWFTTSYDTAFYLRFKDRILCLFITCNKWLEKIKKVENPY